MDRIPEELIYVLVFGGIALVQYLLKRFVPTQQPEQVSEPPPGHQQPARQRVRALERDTQVPKAHKRSNAVRDPRGRTPALTSAAAQAPHSYPQSERPRFSKRSLLESKRQVQNAIVLATILGPCRALEQKGQGQSS